MTTVRSGGPDHDDGTAFVRLRRGSWSMARQISACATTRPKARMRSSARGVATTRTGTGRDSAELRRIRGIYRTKEGAEAALMDHIGMQTR